MPPEIMSKQFTIGAPSNQAGVTQQTPYNYNYYNQKNLVTAQE